ncbi:lanthionine synthetase LanC family protein [Cochleicola gelatinilyticus]|uniref:Lanthionine synthetase C-like protein n=1 Tax=Cochleicola gelatinilyticus TaxID=1763537 RepID=A0A167IQ59_9FLAO|nr:lanthionine synthetase LanC family protein [Cochleicola gelatinilyticus]OAB79901.1 hypothetical protein ULVI_03940 [Cochleicola gelatinilyticus]
MNQQTVAYLKDQLSSAFRETIRNDIGMGKAGAVLFFWYSYRQFNNEEDLKTCATLLEELLENLNKSLQNPTSFIFVELTEVCYLLSILESSDLNKIIALDEIRNDLEKILKETTSKFITVKNLDPYSGGGYIFNYFADNYDKATSALFINFIKENSYTNSKENLVLSLKKDEPIQLGITHGLSFIVLYLSKIAPYTDPDILPLLASFCRTIVSQRRAKDHEGSLFSEYLEDDLKNSKISLCYGDLGIFYSLYRGYEILEDDQKMKELTPYMIKEVNRLEEYFKNTEDTSLLYGSGGVLLLLYFLKPYVQLPELNSLYEKQLGIYRQKVLTTLADYCNKNTLLSKKELSFSQGISGSLILLMGLEQNNLSSAKLFYLDH